MCEKFHCLYLYFSKSQNGWGTLAVFEGYCVSMVPVFTIGTSGSHGVVETLKTLPSGQAARLGVRHINVTRTLARATYFSFLSWVSIVTRGTPEG